jgi:osmotically-inducible protein OsmY
MDDSLHYAGEVAPELSAILPETLAEAEELAASIEQAVHRETGGAVRNLSVEIGREEILLRGFCPSYYCKQLAQHAAMTVPGGKRLSNCIEVEF